MMGMPKYRIPQPRRKHPGPDLMKTVRLRATRLTPQELGEIMVEIRACAARLREGVATELQFEILHTTMQLALEIELRSHFRGMHEHINTAQVALATIHARATASGGWKPTALYWNELDAIASMVELHELQLMQLTAAEIQRFTRTLIARTLSQGGKVEYVKAPDPGVEVSP
jgi:hypothetical protein